MFSRVYVLGWVGLGVYWAREGRGCQRRASLAIALARALRARGFASHYLYRLPVAASTLALRAGQPCFHPYFRTLELF